MDDEQSQPDRSTSLVSDRRIDTLAAASLGALLGLLMGFTTSPVASIAVTGLVALLAGLFGLSDKIPHTFSPGAARRLAAFALTAVLMTPLALWVRVHEFLGPSVQQQRQLLNEIGITDQKEQNEMLRYLRFGLLPSGSVAVPKGSPGVLPVLYSRPATFCGEFLSLKVRRAPLEDFELLFSTSGDEIAKIGKSLSELPKEKRMAALDAATAYLCRSNP